MPLPPAPVPATTLPDLSVAAGQPAVSGAQGAALPATGAVDPLQIQQLQLQLQLLQQQQLQQGQLQQGQEQVATPGAMGSLPPPNGDVAR